MCTRCYNTCFAIAEEDGPALLVDAGGGSGILRQCRLAGLDFRRIHDLIVTHEHCDHILGVVWVVRKIASLMRADNYDGNLTIYCHAGLRTMIETMCRFTLQEKLTSFFGSRIVFQIVEDGFQADLSGWEVTFFDIHSTKAVQFGFSLRLRSGEKLTCLGDEPFQRCCQPYVAGSAWLLCEAFCLYGDRERFRPYEKHHSTVRDACLLAQELGVAHLVLWHTEDERYDRRKQLYTQEGAQFYSGALYVPDDLEVLPLSGQ